MNTILIVDDDEGLVHFLTRLLVRQGYEVASCCDGATALEFLARQEFGAILLDYKMPGLSGLETLVQIKRAQVKTPAIIMTAFGTTETAIEAMKLGAYDYLLKPFDTEELKRIVADALEINRLMKEVVSLPGGAAEVSPASKDGGTVVERLVREGGVLAPTRRIEDLRFTAVGRDVDVQRLLREVREEGA